ncbi:leucyl/phenylalanyl-tRNA--protein transferase [Rheinheimera sp.]|uniref:leucyl/phenylalanyl-tRNA--protein transferase n=1 Tax=Rheinheimera sp. TaxID=1869214 RepID=UPI0040478A03
MAIYLPELAAHDVAFPSLHRALHQPDGLLAMGGDLSVPRLISAYSQAIFPWFSHGDPILWWSPSVRAVFAPCSLTLNRSLRKQLARYQFSFTVNQAFDRVISQCAAPRAKQPGSWILPEMQQAYIALHQQGYAHSIEVWQQAELVGGLYGVQIGSLFCGESMFNLKPDTAKLALVMLQQHLQQLADGWIDCQLPNPFLLQLGATPMTRDNYVALLQQQAVRILPAQHWHSRQLHLNSHG